MSKLQTAVRHLSAVRVRGSRTEWVYFDDSARRYYVVTSDELRELADLLDADPVCGYSFWCGMTDSREMPEGWTPTRTA